jgi:general secretion pathway protein G
MKSRHGGFTLVEVLLVVAILGILSTIAVVAVAKHMDKAREAATKTTIKNLKTILSTYYMDTGSYPAGLAGLLEDDGSKGWKGPYMEEAAADGWDQPFRYQVLSFEKYEIRSAGRDMRMDTDDDLRN